MGVFGGVFCAPPAVLFKNSPIFHKFFLYKPASLC